jgi:hypothetical protein
MCNCTVTIGQEPIPKLFERPRASSSLPTVQSVLVDSCQHASSFGSDGTQGVGKQRRNAFHELIVGQSLQMRDGCKTYDWFFILQQLNRQIDNRSGFVLAQFMQAGRPHNGWNVPSTSKVD